MRNNMVKSVDNCKHVLLAVWGENMYNSQRTELLNYYGPDIFNMAESELYSSRTFQIVFG